MLLSLKEFSTEIKEGTITLWHAHENDRISEGEDLVEISADKATFDVSSPCSGKLKKIFKKEGVQIQTSDIIAEIEEDRS